MYPRLIKMVCCGSRFLQVPNQKNTVHGFWIHPTHEKSADGGKRQVMRGHVVCGKAMAFATSPDHLHVRLPSSPANVWIYNLEADTDDLWGFVCAASV